MNPKFKPGSNIAMKVPAHEFGQTVIFYRDVLGFMEISGDSEGADQSHRFEFGDKVLWLDRVTGLSQAETWLEVTTDNIELAAEYLERMDCVRCDEIETLPEGSNAFWISSPANIVHLVSLAGST